MQEMQVPPLGQEDLLEEWQTTPVFLPRESHGQRSLVGYSQEQALTQPERGLFPYFSIPSDLAKESEDRLFERTLHFDCNCLQQSL